MRGSGGRGPSVRCPFLAGCACRLGAWTQTQCAFPALATPTGTRRCHPAGEGGSYVRRRLQTQAKGQDPLLVARSRLLGATCGQRGTERSARCGIRGDGDWQRGGPSGWLLRGPLRKEGRGVALPWPAAHLVPARPGLRWLRRPSGARGRLSPPRRAPNPGAPSARLWPPSAATRDPGGRSR